MGLLSSQKKKEVVAGQTMHDFCNLCDLSEPLLRKRKFKTWPKSMADTQYVFIVLLECSDTEDVKISRWSFQRKFRNANECVAPQKKIGKYKTV